MRVTKSSVHYWLKRHLGIAQVLLLVFAIGLIANGTPRIEIHSHASDGHAITDVSADHDHGHDDAVSEDSHHVTHVHTAPTLTATLPAMVGASLPSTQGNALRPLLSLPAPPSAAGPPPYRPPIA